MTSFAEQFAKAQQEVASGGGGDFTDLPLGRYTVILDKAFVNKSKKGEGRNQTNLDWVVLEGDYKGQTHRAFHNLDHEVGMKIFIQDFTKLNVDVSDVTSIEDVKAKCEMVAQAHPMAIIVLSKSKRGDFINTKVDTFLGAGSEDQIPSSGNPETSSQSDVPDDSEVTIAVGVKVKYMHAGNEATGIIKEINQVSQTISTALHKNIKLEDILDIVG